MAQAPSPLGEEHDPLDRNELLEIKRTDAYCFIKSDQLRIDKWIKYHRWQKRRNQPFMSCKDCQMVKPIGKPCQHQNITTATYYDNSTDRDSIHLCCFDCGLLGPDVFRPPATASKTPTGALPVLCACTNMSSADDFCPDCGRMRDEQSMPLRRNSLFDIVAQVEDAAAFVRRFHEQATRASEPLSKPPAKQASVATFWSQCAKVLARGANFYAEIVYCNSDSQVVTQYLGKRPITKRDRGFAYAPMGKVTLEAKKDSYRFVQENVGKFNPGDAVPASFQERKHSILVCMRAIAARAEAAQSIKWKVESIYVKHETRSKAWRHPRSTLDESNLPVTPAALQWQLDRLSQLKNPHINPSSNVFWGRQRKSITLSQAMEDGEFHSAIYLAKQPHKLQKTATSLIYNSASLSEDETGVSANALREATPPISLSVPLPPQMSAPLLREERRQHPHMEQDAEPLLVVSGEAQHYTTLLRFCSDDQLVYAVYRSRLRNTYPRYKYAAVTFKSFRSGSWSVHCSCSGFAVALTKHSVFGLLEVIKLRPDERHPPLCDHYSAELFQIARQDILYQPHTAGECQRHNDILFSLVADSKIVFVERAIDVYLCHQRHCGGKLITHRRCHPCTHASTINSVYPISDYGVQPRVDRSVVQDDWLTVDDHGSPVTKDVTYSQYEPDDRYWDLVDRTEADFEPTEFYQDVVVPQLGRIEDWRYANRRRIIPRLETLQPLRRCESCPAAPVAEDSFQCWVATHAGLVLVNIVRRVCSGCNVILDEVDQDFGLYLHCRRQKAISLAFKVVSEELKRSVFYGTVPIPSSVGDTQLKKALITVLIRAACPHFLKTCCHMHEGGSPINIGFDGTSFSITVETIASAKQLASPDCQQCRIPVFPLDRPKRRVVSNPTVFAALRLVRDNKEREDLEVWNRVADIAKSKLTNPDVVESTLLAIFEEGCNTPEAACHALQQARVLSFLSSMECATDFIKHHDMAPLRQAFDSDYESTIERLEQDDELQLITRTSFYGLHVYLNSKSGIASVVWLTMKAFVTRATSTYAFATPIAGCVHAGAQDLDQSRYAGRYNVRRRVARPLPVFMKDKDDKKGPENGECKKHYQAGRHCSVMFAFCMEHRVFLGYHFTPAEGRKDVLAVVYRFWDTMPRAIVYDYACGLAEYFKNRCLHETRDTYLSHDRFHGRTHKQCSDCFDMSRIDPNQACNTSLMEQKNNVVSHLRSMFANAKLPLAHVIMQLAIALVNHRQARRYRAEWRCELKKVV